jgi:hypothetical protein
MPARLRTHIAYGDCCRVTPGSQGSPEQAFAARFAQAWAAPTPEGLVELLHEDVRLYQPNLAPIHGRQQALAEFRRLLGNVPGLHGVVDRSSGMEGLVFIEWRMILPAARPASIGMVDRFLIRDGLALERRVYFDPLSLLLAVIARPGLWGGFMRYRFG